jgi:hypothetical protein
MSAGVPWPAGPSVRTLPRRDGFSLNRSSHGNGAPHRQARASSRVSFSRFSLHRWYRFMAADGHRTLGLQGQAGRILLAGMVVAALDFLYITVLWVLIKHAVTVEQLAQVIATGLLGKAAYEGGVGTAALGVALHLMVALTWTTIFFVLSRQIPAVSHLIETTAGRVKAGLLFGPVIWLVMDLVVLPLSRARPTPVSSPHFYINLLQHAVMIGVPMALLLGSNPRESTMPRKHENTKTRNQEDTNTQKCF